MKSAKRLGLVCMLMLLAGLSSLVRAQEGTAAGRETAGRETSATSQSRAAEQGETDENAAYRHSRMVQKLGGMMGMKTETAATAFEVFNFAMLALAIGWALAKVLPKTFRDRTSVIQKHLVDARTATEEASARLNSVEDRLSHLDGQIAEMRANAEKDAAVEEQRMRAAVEEEKKKIVAAADQEIASAAATAQRQLQKYAAELAIEQAARKLVVSAETDRLLIQGFARRLGGDDSPGGSN